MATSSVPVYDPAPPRRLSEGERASILRVADTLIPDGSAGPRPSRLPGFDARLDRALAARRDAFATITALAERLADVPADALEPELRRLAGDEASGFAELSTVVAGAYLMDAGVRRAIGYAGQAQRPPRFDEAAEQIMDGILDPVVARGPVHRAVAAGGGGT